MMLPPFNQEDQRDEPLIMRDKKPLADCPLCEGSGLLPGLYHITTACGLPTGMNNVRFPCSCLSMRRRGT